MKSEFLEFGKSVNSSLELAYVVAGMELLNGLMFGKSLGEIVDGTRSRVLRDRRSKLEEIVRAGLDQEDVFQLQRCLV